MSLKVIKFLGLNGGALKRLKYFRKNSKSVSSLLLAPVHENVTGQCPNNKNNRRP